MKIVFLALSILLFNFGFSQSSGFKLFLIGDTGEDTTLEPTMKNFFDTIGLYPNSATVFLGDNCYKKFIFSIEKKGFDSSAITVKRLGSQLAGLDSCKYGGSAYFIPGNHDWWNVTSMKRGKRNLKKEESFINGRLAENQYLQNKFNAFMPAKGNAIAAVALNDNQLKLIFLDTQWLIIQKNEDERAEVYEQLDSILNDAILRKQNVVVTAHHPIYTIGGHSKKHCIQFPKALKDQDIYHPLYNSMRLRIDTLLSQKHYPIIYASGHDHVLEYFHKYSVQYIVSGAGSKTTWYNKRKKQAFNPAPGEDIPKNRVAKMSEGYFELEYTGNNAAVRMMYMENKLSTEVINKTQ